jgi:hypothetical protein
MLNKKRHPCICSEDCPISRTTQPSAPSNNIGHISQLLNLGLGVVMPPSGLERSLPLQAQLRMCRPEWRDISVGCEWCCAGNNQSIEVMVMSLVAVQKKRVRRLKRTYNRRDSQMVTHSSTSRPVQCLCMAERTGCPVFTDLWSYVFMHDIQKPYRPKY